MSSQRRTNRRIAAIAALIAAVLALACAHRERPRRSPYELVLLTAEGEAYDFAQLRGRPALITFFATWCLPCMLEVPYLKQLANDYGPRGLQIVAVGVDREGIKVLRPFARSYDLPYPVLVGDAEVLEGRTPYGPIAQVPTTFLLDPEGEIAAAWSGAASPEAVREAVKVLIERQR